MPTTITVTLKLRIQALLEIESPDFAHWYELGIWWAMYGEQQRNGPYRDTYLIEDISQGIQAGWYDELLSGWFPMVGFNLGMLHGGMIDPKTHQLRTSETLVILTDPDFVSGYHVGREYYFFEAPPEEQHLTDTSLIETIHSWALEYHTWQEPEETLRYCLGCRIGALSSALFPLGEQELLQIEAKNRLAMIDRMILTQAL